MAESIPTGAVVTGVFALIAAVVVGLAAVVTSLIKARKERKLHNQTLAIDMMVDAFWKDEELLAKFTRVIQIKDIEKYALPNQTVPREEWLENHCTVVEILNYFEVIATGVKRKIYDREIVEDLMKGLIVRVYRKTRPFIVELRGQDEKEFAEGSTEFEKFAKDLESGRKARKGSF